MLLCVEAEWLPLGAVQSEVGLFIPIRPTLYATRSMSAKFDFTLLLWHLLLISSVAVCNVQAATVSTVITTTMMYTPYPTIHYKKLLTDRAVPTTTLTSTKSYAASVQTVTRTIYADSPLPTVVYYCDNMPRICQNTARSFGLLPLVNGEVELYYDGSTVAGRGGNAERRTVVFCGALARVTY